MIGIITIANVKINLIDVLNIFTKLIIPFVMINFKLVF